MDPFEIFCALLLLFMVALECAAAWIIYFASKWVASFLTVSEIDQAALGILTVGVVGFIVFWQQSRKSTGDK
jgi:hypothetical protein